MLITLHGSQLINIMNAAIIFLGGSHMNTHRILGLSLSVTLSLSITLFTIARAQDDEQSSASKNRGAIYYLGEQDELLMRVNIWGFVLRPGQYMVPKDTDLISLISFAGGPREEAKIKKVKVIRSIAVHDVSATWNDRQLAMNGANGTAKNTTNTKSISGVRAARDKVVYEVNVKKYLKTGDISLIPELEPGDTIIVEGSTFHFITKALDFTAKLAVFVNIYYLIQIANTR